MQSNEDDFSITIMIAINSTNWIRLRQCKKITGTKKIFSLQLNY